MKLNLKQTAFLLIVAIAPLTAFAQDAAATPSVAPAMPSLWNLAIQGGWFMIPIAIASVITIAFTLERMAGLRLGRNLPRKLLQKLRTLAHEGVDPRQAWDMSQEHPSPLANCVQAAVLKAGRPQAELEKAVEDAVERETKAMTRNMRPVNVVASIAPLLGLLGTVQGMIMAFMVTSTTTSTGTAKAQELAHGIYTALVTTFAGLSVAVVSVVLANWLEGKVERTLEKLEAIFLDLLPRFEKFEGRMRVIESLDANGSTIKVTSTRPRTNKSAPATSASKPLIAPSVVEAVAAHTTEPSSVKPRQQRPRSRGTGLNAPLATDAITSDLRQQ